MINRTLIVILFVMLSYVACFGQSSFQQITPGKSTRDYVASVLGEPVRTISATLFEYKPPAGIANVEVEYIAIGAIPVVERIEVYFLKPVSRPAMIKQFSLSQEADASSYLPRLVEYFGGSSLLVLTYTTTDATSGVSHIGYCSPELFKKLTGIGAIDNMRKPEVQLNGIGAIDNMRNPEVTLGREWDMCETAWQTFCETWKHQGNEWIGWGVPLKIDANGTGVRVERYDRATGLKAIYTGTISGNRIEGTVDFCCDRLGERRGTWAATIRR